MRDLEEGEVFQCSLALDPQRWCGFKTTQPEDIPRYAVYTIYMMCIIPLLRVPNLVLLSSLTRQTRPPACHSIQRYKVTLHYPDYHLPPAECRMPERSAAAAAHCTMYAAVSDQGRTVQQFIGSSQLNANLGATKQTEPSHVPSVLHRLRSTSWPYAVDRPKT